MNKILLKAFLSVSSWTGLSRVFGLLRDILLAAATGAGPITDIFLVSFKLPNMFRRLTAEGALVQSFLPEYTSQELKSSKNDANDLAQSIQSTLLISLLLFVLLAELFMGFVISCLAPGFKENQTKFQMSIDFARITITYLPMISLVALWGSIAQASGRFLPLAAAPILLNLSLISGLILILSMKVDPIWLAIMVPVGGILQMIFVASWLIKLGRMPTLSFPKFNSKSYKVWKRFLPAALGAGLLQLNLLVDTILATLIGEGSVSYLYYADRVSQLPLGIIGIALGTVLLPNLSKAEAINDQEYIRNQLSESLKLGNIFSIPASIAFIFIPFLIIEALFYRGSFSENDIKLVSIALTAYGVGLPAFIGIKVLQPGFFAMGDTMTPFRTSIFSVILNILLSIVLMKFLGYAGIALATSIVSYVVLTILLYLLWKRNRISLSFFKPTIIICILGIPLTLLLIIGESLTVRYNTLVALLILILISSTFWFLIMHLLGFINLKRKPIP